MRRLSPPIVAPAPVARVLLVGLLGVALLLCLVHGAAADEHGLAHSVCVPAAALLAAGAVLPIAGRAGWLLATAPLTVITASIHLADPPPKPLARS
jgi:hypothetical protein